MPEERHPVLKELRDAAVHANRLILEQEARIMILEMFIHDIVEDLPCTNRVIEHVQQNCFHCRARKLLTEKP